jgi:hypothetical protein
MKVIKEFRYHDDSIWLRSVKAKSRTGHVYLIQKYDYDKWDALCWQTVSQSNDRDESLFDLGYRVGVERMAQDLEVLK